MPPGNSFSIITGTPNVSATGLECREGKPVAHATGRESVGLRPVNREARVPRCIHTGARFLRPEGETSPAGCVSHRISFPHPLAQRATHAPRQQLLDHDQGTPNVSAAGLECWGKANRWLTPPAGNLSGSALSIGKPASRAGIHTGARFLRPEGETSPAGGVSHRISFPHPLAQRATHAPRKQLLDHNRNTECVGHRP